MMCSRGSMCSERNHKVKTLEKALEWYEYVFEGDLPITVTQHESQNGRVRIEIYDKDMKLIHARG